MAQEFLLCRIGAGRSYLIDAPSHAVPRLQWLVELGWFSCPVRPCRELRERPFLEARRMQTFGNSHPNASSISSNESATFVYPSLNPIRISRAPCCPSCPTICVKLRKPWHFLQSTTAFLFATALLTSKLSMKSSLECYLDMFCTTSSLACLLDISSCLEMDVENAEVHGEGPCAGTRVPVHCMTAESAFAVLITGLSLGFHQYAFCPVRRFLSTWCTLSLTLRCLSC